MCSVFGLIFFCGGGVVGVFWWRCVNQSGGLVTVYSDQLFLLSFNINPNDNPLKHYEVQLCKIFPSVFKTNMVLHLFRYMYSATCTMNMICKHYIADFKICLGNM